MGSSCIIINGGIWKLIFVYKIEIITGLFSGLSIIYYFCEVNHTKKRINNIKKKIKEYNFYIMSENQRIEWIGDNLIELKDTVKDFICETRKNLKEINDNHNDFKLSVAKELAALDKSQGITKAKIAIYISVLVTIGVNVFSLVIK